MDVPFTLDGQPVDATLNGSPAARDLASLLPLTLDLEDFPGLRRHRRRPGRRRRPHRAQRERGLVDRPGFVTASVTDPFGDTLGVMYNQHYLDVLATRPRP
ncbi:cyclophilin-like fold protein [Sphaerisporangium album]|uniref:cyclophilin-like fold protein n=1 Tax=Sphaerisporangium album TaxID=509200 RepID=UPI001FE38914|nr:cyclophilin-like fold protein [Sphaerisporangium album]